MSLFVVGATSATSAIAHSRAGRPRGRTGLVFAATAMAGAYAGGQVVDRALRAVAKPRSGARAKPV